MDIRGKVFALLALKLLFLDHVFAGFADVEMDGILLKLHLLINSNLNFKIRLDCSVSTALTLRW